MQGGCCQICGSSLRQELARSQARPKGPDSRFVLCLHCAHVYRDPMPDEAELSRADVSERSLPRLAGREAGQWLADLVEPLTQQRTVLAIRSALDGLDRHQGVLAPFRERGWSICEVASTSALRIGSSDSVLDARRPWPRRPSRTFSLILGGPIERLPDPVPALRMLRRHLEDDGLLFLSMPNLLDPCPTERMAQELFRGSHARLYSPSAAQTVLARSGFRTDAIRMYRGDGTLGLLGRPADLVPDQPLDDPAALRDLFHVLHWPGSAEVLGWNLASLAETQAQALPALCQQQDRSAFSVRRSGACVAALEGRAEGRLVPLMTWGNMDGYQAGAVEDLKRQIAQQTTIIQLGLGSGEIATHLAEGLRDKQHLFIWEADPALARTILNLVDLSPLWLSRQVSLLLGPNPDLPRGVAWRLAEPAFVFSTDSARQWHPWTYRQIVSRLTPCALITDSPSSRSIY
ncbi:MAG: hypothetical protein KGL03_09750 [Nitrospirota bacterium]|nr:hypothetical protein [Nitrospirota bacterium]